MNSGTRKTFKPSKRRSRQITRLMFYLAYKIPKCIDAKRGFIFSFFEVLQSVLRRFTNTQPGAQRAGQINQGPKAFEFSAA
jgi:hypothetical protein